MKRRDWQEAPDEQWRALLVDGIGAGFRLVGHAPSRKNPNLCVACLEHTPPGGAEVDTTVLFADVRESTRIGGAFVGKVGEERGVSDFTALGDPVNVAARLQSVARGGELVVGADVDDGLDELLPGAQRMTVELKGHEQPVCVVVGRPWQAPVEAIGDGRGGTDLP